MIIDIHIDCGGEDAPVSYHLRQTRCPDDYDGFGTITLARFNDGDGKENRLVLIRESSLQWQEGRYSSGIGGVWTPEHGTQPQDVIRELWERLGTERKI